MGQRLVIAIKNKDGDNLATQYMHWSAYTSSTFECADFIYTSLCHSVVAQETEFAVNLLRKTFPNAALTEDAAEALGIEETRTLNRNDGLIDITLDQMEESLGWAEGVLEIYLDENKEPDQMGVYMGVMYVDDLEDYVMDHEDEFVIRTDPDGTKSVLKKEGESLEPVKIHELDFDGWATNFYELRKLEKLYGTTIADGAAFCVYDDHYFVIQWLE